MDVAIARNAFETDLLFRTLIISLVIMIKSELYTHLRINIWKFRAQLCNSAPRRVRAHAERHPELAEIGRYRSRTVRTVA